MYLNKHLGSPATHSSFKLRPVSLLSQDGPCEGQQPQGWPQPAKLLARPPSDLPKGSPYHQFWLSPGMACDQLSTMASSPQPFIQVKSFPSSLFSLCWLLQVIVTFLWLNLCRGPASFPIWASISWRPRIPFWILSFCRAIAKHNCQIIYTYLSTKVKRWTKPS